MAAHCRESVMDSLAANMTERNDAVYGEDCVGILYQPNPDDTTVYQFYVNPIGTVYDQRITSPGVGSWDGDPTWLGEYELKTSRGDDYWCIEVRIPLDQFGIQAKSGDSWRVNFRRKQKRLDNNAGWQIPWSYNPNTFGMLLFE